MSKDARFDYCPVLQDLVAQEKRGASTVNNLVVLRRLLRALGPTRTLETGFAWGASCLAFTAWHSEWGEPAKQHVAIDPFQHDWQDAGLAAVERAKLTAYLDFRREPSSLALPQLVREGAKFGLIYVDGSHLFEDVMLDAYYGFHLLPEGGVIAFDDSTSADVAKALRFLRRNAVGLKEISLARYREDGASLRYRLATKLKRVQLTAFRRVGKELRNWSVPLHRF